MSVGNYLNRTTLALSVHSFDTDRRDECRCAMIR